LKILIFTNGLGLGGTEKAACRWARGLQERGHQVLSLTLADGLRRAELERAGIPVRISGAGPAELAAGLRELSPEVIQAHAPGFPHAGDALGAALKLLPQKIPVVQTNIFGRLQNPAEDQWTDFRLFISWTSCVQAARRSCRKLDENFFRRASVAVYPLDAIEPAAAGRVAAFRRQHGVRESEVLFGRLSRPEPNKWTNLALDAFRLTLRRTSNIKLLLREPPPAVAAQLRVAPDADRFVILPATADAEELRLTMSALDVVLHTSSIGESFGYGIAEPMNLGKPVVTHSVPWEDQAQIELARHGECGFVTSTPAAMAAVMVRLAENRPMREKMGAQAQAHIRALADPTVSVSRLECILRAAIEKESNPLAGEDLARARAAAGYLDEHQFGHSLREQAGLRPFHYRVRFHQWRKARFAR
jgi:glycosyltransferase involved in cell wall biosynthesis